MSEIITRSVSVTRTDEASADPMGPWRVIASTEAVDSYDDIVEQDWDLSRFAKGGPILLQHNAYGLPIGKSIKAEVMDIAGAKALVVEFMFDPRDEDGVRVAHKFADGFMKDVSVGFRSFKRTLRAMLPDGDPRKAERGYILSKNVLLELSTVTIGANPEAKVIKAAPDLLSALEARVRALEDAVTRPPSPAPSAKRDPLAELFGLEK